MQTPGVVAFSSMVDMSEHVFRMFDMSCGQSESWMMDALDGAIHPSEQQRLIVHLKTCQECHAAWEALNAIETMLVNPTVLHPVPGFVDRVEARIVRFEAQRRTFVGGLILLGAAVAICLLAVPSLLNGRSPLEAYGEFLHTVYSLLGSGVVLSYKLVSALWLTLEVLSRSADVPLANLLTYALGAVLAAAAVRRAWVTPRLPAQAGRNGR
jgi:hypothetical protein